MEPVEPVEPVENNKNEPEVQETVVGGANSQEEAEKAKKDFMEGADKSQGKTQGEPAKPSSIIVPGQPQRTPVPNAKQNLDKPLHVKEAGKDVYAVVDNNGKKIRVYDKREGVKNPKESAETYVATH